MRRYKKKTVIFYSTLIIGITVTVFSVLSALSSINKIFPSFFFDPAGIYSIIKLPEWQYNKFNLTRKHTIIKIDSIEIGNTTGYLNNPGNRIYSLLNKSSTNGNSSVSITFKVDSMLSTITCPLRKIGGEEILLLHLVYLFFAWFSLLFVLILWKYIHKKNASFVFLLVAITLCFIFLSSFFDYHTNGWLVPVFQLSNISLTLCTFYLTLLYPFNLIKKKWIIFTGILIGIYCILAITGNIILPLFNHRPLFNPVIIDMIQIYAFIGSGILLLIRIAVSRNEERKSILTILIINAGMILFLGLCVVTPLKYKINAILFMVDIVVPLVPAVYLLLFCYAIFHHNILDTHIVFKKGIFILPNLFLSLAVTTIIYSVFSLFSHNKPGLSLIDICMILSTLCVFLWLFNKITVYLFFNSSYKFKPTIALLSEQLFDAKNEQAIIEILRNVIRKWLVYHQVSIDIIMEDQADTHIHHPRCKRFPVASQNNTIGYITITSAQNSPLLTEDDIILLNIISGFAALAINNTRNMNKLDSLYKQNIDLTRKEHSVSLKVFGAEIAHEIRYPLSYFNYILSELENNHSLTSEDIQLGKDEVNRLERMVSALPKMQHASIALQPVNINEMFNRVIILIKDILDKYQINISISVPPALSVMADKNLCIQLFSNLLKNASEACGDNGSVEVCFEKYDSETFAIGIKDSGKGFSNIDIFSPWISTKKDGMGVGLTVCQRIVRSFEWKIIAARRDDRTCFYIHLPEKAIITI